MTVSAEDLFRDAFFPHYPEDAKVDLVRARTVDANPAGNPSIAGHLEEAAAIFAKMAPAALGRDLDLDFSDASVHRLSAALSREKRDRWMSEPDYGTPGGTIFNVVVHGSAYVGECIVRAHGGTWLARRPLWESLVRLRSAAGEAELAVFHWWLKSFADDALAGTSASLADRYRTHVEVPTLDAAKLPAVLATERKLPRLAKVKYDALYKYLRAHVPEIRDVGRDFPSPERLDEMRLRWLDAHRVGGGRMLLLAGAGEGGVYMFWLDGSGFVKSAFVPADKFPDPVVEVAEDRIRVLGRVDGKDVAHEMLWWGL